MNWILIVVTAAGVLNNRVETTVTEQHFATNKECVAAMSKYQPGRDGIRMVYCRNNNNGKI